jgi:NitT/TauT family transport system ATP-binding protein
MGPEPGKLVVENLAFSYRTFGQGENRVLENVSFVVQPGKVGVLLGVNGSGKTTILNIVAGLCAPQKGKISLDGSPPKRGEVGYVFQDYRQTLLPWRTVRNNLTLPLEIQGIDRQLYTPKVRNTLDFMRLDLPLDSFPYKLSGGQQQMLAIARTLVGSPRLLLLDEPFSALDTERHSTIQEKIAGLIEQTNITTLIVVHDIGDAILLADNVFILRNGKISGELTIALEFPRTIGMLNSRLARDYKEQLQTWLH